MGLAAAFLSAALALVLLVMVPRSESPALLTLGALALGSISAVGTAAVCPLIFVLATFLPEHSQTEWGVRSAADFVSFYNLRPWSAVPVSVFDLVVAAGSLLWLSTPGVLPSMLSRLAAHRRLRTALTAAAVFLAVAAIVGGFGVVWGRELYHVLREVRPLLYFLILLLVAAHELLKRGAARRFTLIAAGAVTVHGVEGVVRSVLGIGRWKWGRMMIYFDFADSLALAFGLLLAGAFWIRPPAAPRGRAMGAILLATAVIGYTFAFSFRRSVWLGLAAGLFVVLWRGTPRERFRLAAFGTAGALSASLLAVGAVTLRASLAEVETTPAAALEGQARQVAERLTSIAKPKSESANRFRIYDTLNAAGAVRDSVGLGLGFGSRYRVVWSDEEQRKFLEHVSRTSHNSYLYLAMKMGVAGLLCWLWLVWEISRGPLEFRGGGFAGRVSVTVVATLATTAVAALFMPVAYNVRPMVLLALIGGLGLAVTSPNRTAAR